MAMRDLCVSIGLTDSLISSRARRERCLFARVRSRNFAVSSVSPTGFFLSYVLPNDIRVEY